MCRLSFPGHQKRTVGTFDRRNRTPPWKRGCCPFRSTAVKTVSFFQRLVSGAVPWNLRRQIQGFYRSDCPFFSLPCVAFYQKVKAAESHPLLLKSPAQKVFLQRAFTRAGDYFNSIRYEIRGNAQTFVATIVPLPFGGISVFFFGDLIIEV